MALAEAQRVQVRILHRETQPHRPARQLAHITAAFPRHHPFGLVADLFHRVSQRLAQLYEATGQSEKATEWNRKLAEFGEGEAGKKTAALKP